LLVVVRKNLVAEEDNLAAQHSRFAERNRYRASPAVDRTVPENFDLASQKVVALQN
jgi:hypothetical protein